MCQDQVSGDHVDTRRRDAVVLETILELSVLAERRGGVPSADVSYVSREEPPTVLYRRAVVPCGVGDVLSWTLGPAGVDSALGPVSRTVGRAARGVSA